MPGYDMVSVTNAFTYHPPTGTQAESYEYIRAAGLNMASTLLHLCPQSPETTTALNKLREAVMWANASIACNGEKYLD